MVYFDLKDVAHEVKKIHVLPDKPYIQKTANSNKQTVIRLLTFYDFMSFYRFLDKFPIHSPKFIDFSDVVANKLRTLDEYNTQHNINILIDLLLCEHILVCLF